MLCWGWESKSSRPAILDITENNSVQDEQGGDSKKSTPKYSYAHVFFLGSTLQFSVWMLRLQQTIGMSRLGFRPPHLLKLERNVMQSEFSGNQQCCKTLRIFWTSAML